MQADKAHAIGVIAVVQRHTNDKSCMCVVLKKNLFFCTYKEEILHDVNCSDDKDALISYSGT